MNEPKPKPKTNQKNAEKPKYIVAVPGGISSFLAKRYLSSIVVTSPLKAPILQPKDHKNLNRLGSHYDSVILFIRYHENHMLENANTIPKVPAIAAIVLLP